jgi:selenocysteine lyase/cysteine desulfurase
MMLETAFLERSTSRQVAERLGRESICVWDGNYYALAVTERLGVEADGGMVRVGAYVTIRWGKWIDCWLWSMT